MNGIHKLNTAGGEEVLLTGRGFGTIERNAINRVVYGMMQDGEIGPPLWRARDCSVVEDHTMISCKTAPGVGKNLQWKVTIDEQETQIRTTKYKAPTISRIDEFTRKDAGRPGRFKKRRVLKKNRTNK